MHISKLAAVAFLAAAVLPARSQPASPENQSKAVELLRQTLAEERQHPTLVIPTPSKAAPATQQEQAIQLLRQTISEQRSAPMAAPETTQSAKPSKGASGKASTSKTAGAQPKATSTSPVQAGGTGTVPAPAPTEAPAGPKTKQQRLMDLLDLYKADKLTPAQYQAERAKILAEP